jgi:mxaL protein
MKMMQWMRLSREQWRTVAIGAALGWLLPALLPIRLPLPQRVFEGIVIIDITQSMDVPDMRLLSNEARTMLSATRSATRLEFAKESLWRAIPGLPCGSKLGLGVFTEYRSLLLLEPVEVCANSADLQETVRNIEGRMAWSGNSEVAKGLYWALKLAARQKDKPALVFMTDGHEAPPINADNRLAYPGTAGEVKGLLVGVGGSLPMAIPKRDPNGLPIGVWLASEVSQVNPFGASVGKDPAPDSGQASNPSSINKNGAAVSTMRTQAELLGATAGTEHLSALRAGYLALLAGEVGLSYASPTSEAEVGALLKRNEVSQWRWQHLDASWLFAVMALCSLIAFVLLGYEASAISSTISRLRRTAQ